jgi:hypothetical protein
MHHSPDHEHEPDIRAAMAAIHAAGFVVAWIPAARPGGAHEFTARNAAGEFWAARGREPRVAVVELMQALGFEDMD